MKKLLGILLASAMVLSMVGCSSGSSDSSASSDGDAAPLKIVYCGAALSSEYGDRADQVLNMAAQQINDAGGINGAMVEIELIDGGTDQQGYIDGFLRAIEVEGVSAIIGTFYSQYALACTDYIEEAQIPVFNIATNFEMREASEYYYTNRCVDTAFSNTMAQIAIDNGVTNPASLFYNSSNGYNDNEFMKNYMEENGFSVAAEIPFDNANTTDYTSIVLQAMNAPDSDGLLLHATANTDGQSIITLLAQYGYEYPIISNSNLFSESFISNVGVDAAAGLIGFAEYTTTQENAANIAFQEALFADEVGFTYDTISWIDASFYDAFSLIVEGARLIGANDKDSLHEGLKLISDYDGVMSMYTYHDDGSYADNIYLAEVEADGSVTISETLDVPH